MEKSKQRNDAIRWDLFQENSSACRVDDDWRGLGLEAQKTHWEGVVIIQMSKKGPKLNQQQ